VNGPLLHIMLILNHGVLSFDAHQEIRDGEDGEWPCTLQRRCIDVTWTVLPTVMNVDFSNVGSGPPPFFPRVSALIEYFWPELSAVVFWHLVDTLWPELSAEWSHPTAANYVAHTYA